MRGCGEEWNLGNATESIIIAQQPRPSLWPGTFPEPPEAQGNPVCWLSGEELSGAVFLTGAYKVSLKRLKGWTVVRDVSRVKWARGMSQHLGNCIRGGRRCQVEGTKGRELCYQGRVCVGGSEGLCRDRDEYLALSLLPSHLLWGLPLAKPKWKPESII